MAAVIQKHYYKYMVRSVLSKNGMYIIVENDPIWRELIVEMHISDVVNVAKEIKGRSVS